MRTYYVYIVASLTRKLHIGSTSDLKRRLYEHKHRLIEGFTAKYNMNRLVYYEETTDARAVVERERQLKGWRREKKVALIHSVDPAWKDLSAEWFEDVQAQRVGGDSSLRSE
ncbi:GIY-YIG nuclease family protein [bacterium]|nr:GIY-YIG nuclease family protein [bacterium]MBU1983118.1 GIY-YIG nuclease family protein [bacterium]